MIDEKLGETISKLLTEKNINFLIGSGASYPFFPTLGNVEKYLTKNSLTEETQHLVYAIYFNKVIMKNKDLFGDKVEGNKVKILDSYYGFIDNLTKKMFLRNSRLSPNRVNIFTTNYDIFFEKAIDLKLNNNQQLFFNDGANGYFNRILSSNNYHRTMSLNGVFDNYQKEIPMINLVKCHGSITWEKVNDDLIKVNKHVGILDDILAAYGELKINKMQVGIFEKYLIEENTTALNAFSEKRVDELKAFYEVYNRLLIINPEKSKFQHTVLHEYYYSMLRLLSYELEKEQTILIVFGFSFADEHIANLIKRSLSNPFLQVYIFCHNEDSEKDILIKLGFSEIPSNIFFISPSAEDSAIDFTNFNKIIFGGY